MILPCFGLEWTPVLPKLLVRFYSDASYRFTFLRMSVGVEKRELWINSELGISAFYGQLVVSLR